MNKKLQFLLTNIALDSSPFGKTWYSASKCFQDSLIARGVKLPEPLYYEYKLPGGIKPAAYMSKLALYNFFIEYDSWGHFYLEKNNEITEQEKDLIVDEIRAKKVEYAQRLLNDANELLKLNPNLQHLSINSQNAFDVLAGAVFWYMPRNIEYFIDGKKRDLDKERENGRIIRSFGIEEPYGVLAPEIADMVISALKEHAQQSYIIAENRAQKN